MVVYLFRAALYRLTFELNNDELFHLRHAIVRTSLDKLKYLTTGKKKYEGLLALVLYCYFKIVFKLVMK
jgi:hypothetical protein